ncbi:MAG: sodium-dependent transporter [Acidobacteriota bacterium]
MVERDGSAAGRGEWRNRAGFVLAAAGSAIGLGNIWRFPSETARNGGAAFLVVYLACVALVGVPVMLAELSIGRRTRRNPVGAFMMLRPRTAWPLLGGLGVLTGIAILSFYSVVAGWTIGYLLKAVRGDFSTVEKASHAESFFRQAVGNGHWNLLLHGLFLALTVFIVVGGIKKGIELASRIMMPVLLVLLLGLVFFSISLEGSGSGLSFYLKPHWSDITPQVVVAAMGQAFFSLSLGMGAMITYGSYLNRKENLLSSACLVAGMDTLIAFLAGLAIFPAFAAAGANLEGLEGGAGLIFVVLPTIFSSIPFQPIGGILFGGAFFLLLSLAALTSTISLLEVGVSWAVDELRWTRLKASILLGLAAFMLGIPSAFANGGSRLFSGKHWLGMNFMDAMAMIFITYSLTVGAWLICIFAGWVWGTKAAAEEVRAGCENVSLVRAWTVLVRYLCPLAIAIILAVIYFRPGVIPT